MQLRLYFGALEVCAVVQVHKEPAVLAAQPASKEKDLELAAKGIQRLLQGSAARERPTFK